MRPEKWQDDSATEPIMQPTTLNGISAIQRKRVHKQTIISLFTSKGYDFSDKGTGTSDSREYHRVPKYKLTWPF